MQLDIKAADLKDDATFDRYARLSALNHAQRTSYEDKPYRPLEIVSMAEEYYAFITKEIKNGK